MTTVYDAAGGHDGLLRLDVAAALTDVAVPTPVARVLLGYFAWTAAVRAWARVWPSGRERGAGCGSRG